MKAIVFTSYGPPDVLKLKEIDKPIPKDKEVLIKVHASSVNYGDLLARSYGAVSPRDFNMPSLFWLLAKLYFGFRAPKKSILGNEFAGEVESVGKEVTLYKAGDQVFGSLGQSMGAYAEYICISENSVMTAKPANVSYEQAAVIPMGAIMAIYILRRVNVHSGQKILINGASGSIGSAAVQIAKNSGAEVTGVCSTPRIEYVKALGADKVIDYTQKDFTKNGETYDIIFDVLGKSSFSGCKNSLTQDGLYVLASFKIKQLMQMLRTSFTSGKKVKCVLAPGSKEDLIAVKELLEAAKIKVIIDRCFPLEQTSEAHRYVEGGQKRGSVAIVMGR